MRIVTTSAVALAAALLVGSASPSLAKGHNQGFGNQMAGPATAGKVDDGQSNAPGSGVSDTSTGPGRSATSYGQSDATIDAKDGIPGNSVDAQNRSAEHPSNR